MSVENIAPTYRIWSGQTAEAPLELPALVGAIKALKVRAETWLYLDRERKWLPAAEVAELKMFFRKAAAPPPPGAPAPSGPTVKTGTLRRIKVFADLDEAQLEVFVRYMEIVEARQFQTIVRKGDPGDSMFLVLEGEVRARTFVDEKETTLATLSGGEMFGEMALLDHGPRSADVVANVNSILLKISNANFERLMRDAPQAAGPFILALSKTVIARLRSLTKRFEDSIHFSRMGAEAS